MNPELWTKTKLYDLYQPTRDPSRLVVVNPGWLGENTISHDVIEQAVGELDLAVAVVRQRPLRRPQTFHKATKQVSEALGIEEVEVVDHSLGHLDVSESLEYQAKKRGGYIVRHLTAVDGVATNGEPIDISALLEGVNMTRDSHNYGVVARSIGNFLRNMPAQTLEGLRAYVQSSGDELDHMCRKAGAKLDYEFHSDDRVIRTPSDKRVAVLERRGSRVSVRRGGHLETASRPDTLHAILRTT